MKIYFLIIVITLAGHNPSRVQRQAINTTDGYKPVQTMAECRKVAKAMQQRLHESMLNTPDVFDGEPSVTCQERDKLPWKYKAKRKHKSKQHMQAVPHNK